MESLLEKRVPIVGRKLAFMFRGRYLYSISLGIFQAILTALEDHTNLVPEKENVTEKDVDTTNPGTIVENGLIKTETKRVIDAIEVVKLLTEIAIDTEIGTGMGTLNVIETEIVN